MRVNMVSKVRRSRRALPARFSAAAVCTLLAIGATVSGAARADNSITIQNSSFEDPTKQADQFTQSGAISLWSSSAPSVDYNGVGVWHAVSPSYFSTAVPDGKQIGYIGDGTAAGFGQSIAQQTTSSVTANTNYTLSAFFGNRLDGFSGVASLQLYAGGTVLDGVVTGGTKVASLLVDQTTITAGTFKSFDATFHAGSSFAGQMLSVRIVDASGAGVNGNQVDFDRVRLTSAAAPVPEAGTLVSLFGLVAGGGLIAFRRQRRIA
jgi:hypothetical protein